MPEPIDAEVVDERPTRRVDPDPPAGADAAPLHVELHAWPELLKGRVIVTQKGKRREFTLDGSALAMLISFIARLR